ncbi:hypothetical protein GDO78_009440 [Eleutherodactylus coqui]|uniref:Uncharacterized protein n=1 Tax=Eleutherodactylus coqui TaxID=57060 RepID=A0A8J6FBE3_ELECQ|nr:hypothetical protein GDO78_009440 [Eleutherodactylus coqui]
MLCPSRNRPELAQENHLSDYSIRLRRLSINIRLDHIGDFSTRVLSNSHWERSRSFTWVIHMSNFSLRTIVQVNKIKITTCPTFR